MAKSQQKFMKHFLYNHVHVLLGRQARMGLYSLNQCIEGGGALMLIKNCLSQAETQ
jgi:hypothetical protein